MGLDKSTHYYDVNQKKSHLAQLLY